jgi:hypothetical protein
MMSGVSAHETDRDDVPRQRASGLARSVWLRSGRTDVGRTELDLRSGRGRPPCAALPVHEDPAGFPASAHGPTVCVEKRPSTSAGGRDQPCPRRVCPDHRSTVCEPFGGEADESSEASCGDRTEDDGASAPRLAGVLRRVKACMATAKVIVTDSAVIAWLPSSMDCHSLVARAPRLSPGGRRTRVSAVTS